MITKSGEEGVTNAKPRLPRRTKNDGIMLSDEEIELNMLRELNFPMPPMDQAILDPSNSQSKIIDLCIKYDDKLCFFSNPFQIKKEIILSLCDGCRFLRRYCYQLRGKGLLLGKNDCYDDGGLTYG